MFEQIERPPTSAATCANAIRRSILSGELEPGDRLPAERGLAERFGVNRVTVRSALTELMAAGLLSVRQGSGYMVRDFMREGGPELLPGLVELAVGGDKLGEVLADLLFVRRHMARGLLERVLEVADAEDIQRVHDRVEAFATVAEQGAGPDECAQADLAVVSALLEASHSAVMRLCLNPVVTMLSRLPHLRAAVYTQPMANVTAWRGLVSALQQGDPGVPDNIVATLAEFDRVALGAMGMTP